MTTWALGKLQKLPMIALAGIAGLFIIGAASAVTFTVNTTTTSVGIQGAALASDADVTIGGTDYIKTTSAVAAAGATAPGVEATAGNPTITPGISAGERWIYQFTVTEVGNDSWPAGRKYSVEAFADGVSLGKVFFQNGTADSVVEGVLTRWDLGNVTTLPSVTMKVTRIP